MKGYKAFKNGMVCRDKQYAENTIFEEVSAEICECGMHFCKEPLDVLDYYPLIDDNGNVSEFAEVEALDECKTDDGRKYCTKKLKIGSKIDFATLVQASVAATESANKENNEHIGNSGYNAQIGSSGDNARIGSSGYNAQIGSSGDWAQIGSSGDYAQIGSSGDYAQIGSSGGCAQIGSSGKDSVICCAGNNCIVKAKKGSWITLAEWGFVNGEYKPLCVKTEFVDGDRIKEDVFYALKGGKFVEVA